MIIVADAPLIGLPIFVFVLVIAHAEIALVATLGNVMVS